MISLKVMAKKALKAMKGMAKGMKAVKKAMAKAMAKKNKKKRADNKLKDFISQLSSDDSKLKDLISQLESKLKSSNDAKKDDGATKPPPAWSMEPRSRPWLFWKCDSCENWLKNNEVPLNSMKIQGQVTFRDLKEAPAGPAY